LAASVRTATPRPSSEFFHEWTRGRRVDTLGTNTGSPPLAFQTWHRFKEAFSPEFVRDALGSGDAAPTTCIDPFGGSGTTALTAQLLGISATTIEVNPFLVDLIRAKTTLYSPVTLSHLLAGMRRSRARVDDIEQFGWLPATFVEPGVAGKWLFDRSVARRIARLTRLIQRIDDQKTRRFFRVILGGMLVEVSNVVVSGKGRRYRQNWKRRRHHPDAVDRLFFERASVGISDISRFINRPSVRIDVIAGDARVVTTRRLHDVAIFSPPYPNSFDYTDVYNVELWMLGYLGDMDHNRELRLATLCSHVQLNRPASLPPNGSPILDATLAELGAARQRLWNPSIPEMIASYFADLVCVIQKTIGALRPSASCWIVLGDSQYGGVRIPTAQILEELAPSQGWRVLKTTPFRSMRTSPQHGGRAELPETLLVLTLRA
jgi:hypothetical protein